MQRQAAGWRSAAAHAACNNQRQHPTTLLSAQTPPYRWRRGKTVLLHPAFVIHPSGLRPSAVRDADAVRDAQISKFWAGALDGLHQGSTSRGRHARVGTALAPHAPRSLADARVGAPHGTSTSRAGWCAASRGKRARAQASEATHARDACVLHGPRLPSLTRCVGRRDRGNEGRQG